MTAPADTPCNAWFAFGSATEPTVGFRVSYQPIVESIIDALASHLEAGYFPIAVDQSYNGSAESAASGVRTAEHRVKELTAEKEQLLATISSGVLSEALLRELDGKYRALTDQLADAHSRLNDARLEVERARLASDTQRAKQHLDSLLLFVSGLRDPHSPLAAQFFHTCVRNLAFQAHDLPSRKRQVSWTGAIEFIANDQRLAVPFSGSHTTLRPVAADESWALNRLLEGTPLGTDVATRRLMGTRPKVRPKDILPSLNLDKSESWIIHVGDSLLLRAYLTLFAEHPDLPTWGSLIPDITRDVGEPGEFEKALRRCHHATTSMRNPQWIHARAPRETESLITAALGQPVTPDLLLRTWVSDFTGIAEPWAVANGLRHVPPCRHCHSHRRARFTIDEPLGYVCLDCRRDQTGLTWPTRMDRFIAYPELWVAAGFNLELPTPPAKPKPKRVYSNRRHRLSSLPTEDVLAILDAYRAGTPLASICQQHRLRDAHDIYHLLDKHNIPRRRFQ